MENNINETINNEQEVINTEVTDEVTEIAQTENSGDSIVKAGIGLAVVAGAGYGLYRLGKKVFKTTKTFVVGGIKACREATPEEEPKLEEAPVTVEGDFVEVTENTETEVKESETK